MDLIIANRKIALQNEEKQKREEELVVANKELAFQNEEKEKRATELMVANNELKKVEAALVKSITISVVPRMTFTFFVLA